MRRSMPSISSSSSAMRAATSGSVSIARRRTCAARLASRDSVSARSRGRAALKESDCGDRVRRQFERLTARLRRWSTHKKPGRAPLRAVALRAQRECEPLGAKPLEIGIEPLVELLGIDASLVTAKMNTKQPRDSGRIVSAQQLPRRIAVDKLRELENLGDGWHASIVGQDADIDAWAVPNCRSPDMGDFASSTYGGQRAHGRCWACASELPRDSAGAGRHRPSKVGAKGVEA